MKAFLWILLSSILIVATGCSGSYRTKFETVDVRFPNDDPNSAPDQVGFVEYTTGSWAGGKTTYIQPVHSRHNQHIYPDSVSSSTAPAVTMNFGANAHVVWGRITGLSRTTNNTNTTTAEAEGGDGGQGGDGGDGGNADSNSNSNSSATSRSGGS